MISVSISSAKSLVGNSNEGIPVFSAYLTVNGLTQGTANTFSSTRSGAPSGSALLGSNPVLMHPPVYIPTDASNVGAWLESALPTQDADGNLEFSLHPAAGNGPTSFRIGIMFALN
jgi:hypothetical protein